jgi:hypothetical protein
MRHTVAASMRHTVAGNKLGRDPWARPLRRGSFVTVDIACTLLRLWVDGAPESLKSKMLARASVSMAPRRGSSACFKLWGARISKIIPIQFRRADPFRSSLDRRSRRRHMDLTAIAKYAAPLQSTGLHLSVRAAASIAHHDRGVGNLVRQRLDAWRKQSNAFR